MERADEASYGEAAIVSPPADEVSEREEAIFGLAGELGKRVVWFRDKVDD